MGGNKANSTSLSIIHHLESWVEEDVQHHPKVESIGVAVVAILEVKFDMLLASPFLWLCIYHSYIYGLNVNYTFTVFERMKIHESS